MNERKKLKKQLSNKYIFKMYLSVNDVKKLLSQNPKDKHDTLFASLTVGCVKINAVVFPTPDKMLLGFDILVKDTPESEEWICYDTLSDEIKLSPHSIEQSMFDILNREVKEYGLSYTFFNSSWVLKSSVSAKTLDQIIKLAQPVFLACISSGEGSVPISPSITGLPAFDISSMALYASSCAAWVCARGYRSLDSTSTTSSPGYVDADAPFHTHIRLFSL